MSSAELENLSATIRKRSNRVAERGLYLFLDEESRRRSIDLRASCRERLAALLDALVPEVIQRPIASRLEEIGLRRALPLERFTPPPQLEHHVLNDFLGDCPRSNERFRRPYEAGVPRAEDLIERAFISVAESLEKLVAFQTWLAKAGEKWTLIA